MVGIPNLIKEDSATTLYYLLYAEYGNSVIASSDLNRFKYKLFSIIFMYGPAWEKKLEIQKNLRNLSEEELMKGSKQIYNKAYNPSSIPSTSSLDELTYINEQTAAINKRDRLTAYSNLLLLLKTDVTKEFIDKFKVLFLKVVAPEAPLLYETTLLPGTYSEDDDQELIKGYPGSLYGRFRQKTFTDVYETENDFIEDFRLGNQENIGQGA